MNKLIQSYVEEKWFVSTIHRESSTIPPMWYYETIVWEWNAKTRKREEMIYQGDSGSSKNIALENHLTICDKLLANKALIVPR